MPPILSVKRFFILIKLSNGCVLLLKFMIFPGRCQTFPKRGQLKREGPDQERNGPFDTPIPVK